MLQQRRLGRTGQQSTVVTFGGAALSRATQDVADAAIQAALDHGVNHIDVAPSYGEAELRLGPWMPQIRHRVFLGCKTRERTRDAARAGLERSLQRLQTNRFDLFQLHSVGKMADLDLVTARGGALEAVIQARDEGLTRFVGITGHTHDAPSTMAEALRRYDFDTVMLPLNFVLYSIPQYRRDFDALMEKCRARDVGVHIIKTAARGPWGDRPRTHTTWYEPFTEQQQIDRAVRFVLSQPVTTLCSPSDVGIMRCVLDAAERFTPLSVVEQAELIASAAQFSTPFVGEWA